MQLLRYIINNDYYQKNKPNADDIVDKDKMIAFLEWDILEKKSNLGVTRIIFFEDFTDDEIEILLLIASSTFLLFRRYMKELEASRTVIANM